MPTKTQFLEALDRAVIETGTFEEQLRYFDARVEGEKATVSQNLKVLRQSAEAAYAHGVAFGDLGDEELAELPHQVANLVIAASHYAAAENRLWGLECQRSDFLEANAAGLSLNELEAIRKGL